MKKICSGCGEERDEERDFAWKNKNRGVRQTRCRFCQSQASKRHYKSNKQEYFGRARTREVLVIEDNQKRLIGYLSNHPCVDCGKNDIRVLEFDHVRGEKLGDVSRMVSQGFSWTTIDAEIAKCEIRCANCHRIKTNEKSGWWRHHFTL